MMFTKGQLVKHVVSGAIYKIKQKPSKRRLLENTLARYYVYSSNILPKYSWVRCQKEMEDGRFVAISEGFD